MFEEEESPSSVPLYNCKIYSRWGQLFLLPCFHSSVQGVVFKTFHCQHFGLRAMPKPLFFSSLPSLLWESKHSSSKSLLLHVHFLPVCHLESLRQLCVPSSFCRKPYSFCREEVFGNCWTNLSTSVWKLRPLAQQKTWPILQALHAMFTGHGYIWGSLSLFSAKWKCEEFVGKFEQRGGIWVSLFSHQWFYMAD